MQAQIQNGGVAEATTNSFCVGDHLACYALEVCGTGFRSDVCQGDAL